VTSSIHHGKPEKETPFEDEQAQAQKALEVESPQEAYVAEVTLPVPTSGLLPFVPPSDTAGFLFFTDAGGGR
jgi:hypothetical protein